MNILKTIIKLNNMNLKLTDKEVSSIVVSINLMTRFIKSTTDKHDDLTPQKKELVNCLINVINKINKED